MEVLVCLHITPHPTEQDKPTKQKKNTNKKQQSKMISTYTFLFLCKYQGVLNIMLAQLFPIFRIWKGNEDMSGRNLSLLAVYLNGQTGENEEISQGICMPHLQTFYVL